MSLATLNKLLKKEDLDNIDQVIAYTSLSQSYIRNSIALRSGEDPLKGNPETLPSEIEQLRSAGQNLQQKTHSTRTQVQDMTRDIKNLDRTKENLVSSVTVLKRLQMLTKLHSELDSLLRERRYKDLAHTLAAATELTEYFRGFRSLPHVAHLSQLVADQQKQIRTQVSQDVHAFIEGKQKSLGELAWACRAANNRDELVGWYTNYALASYLQIFSIGSEAAGLDNIERRYGMLRNLLNKHSSEMAAAFPPEWNVGVELARNACTSTRESISLLQFGTGQQSVQQLLDALQQTTEFEGYLRRKFPEFAADFQSPISRAFTPHLSIWVDFHDRTLAEKLQLYQSHTWDEEPENSDVFASSADLFLYYRNAMDQMSKLTTGQPFSQLAKVFAKWLSRYANLLKGYLPRAAHPGPEEITVSGKILKTADYCIATTSQLEAAIYNQVDEALKQEVVFDVPNEQFFGVIRACLDVFVEQVESTLRNPWREMANVNWARLQQAGDQSGYVNQLCMTIKLTTDAVNEALAKPSHRRLVCDRVVDHVSLQFLTTAMTRAKPVSEVAAEQLLVDLFAIKGTLLELLSDEKFKESATSKLLRVESVLKVLLTQQSPTEGLTRNYLLLTKDASVANFRKVLDAKGVRFQNRFVECFQEMVTPDLKHDLAPLSQVSMVPKPVPKTVTSPRVASPQPAEPMSKFSDNFKRIGDFLRRDTPNGSPLLR